MEAEGDMKIYSRGCQESTEDGCVEEGGGGGVRGSAPILYTYIFLTQALKKCLCSISFCNKNWNEAGWTEKPSDSTPAPDGMKVGPNIPYFWHFAWFFYSVLQMQLR